MCAAEVSVHDTTKPDVVTVFLNLEGLMTGQFITWDAPLGDTHKYSDTVHELGLHTRYKPVGLPTTFSIQPIRTPSVMDIIGTYNTPIIAYPCSGLHLLEINGRFLRGQTTVYSACVQCKVRTAMCRGVREEPIRRHMGCSPPSSVILFDP
jgi:hypothetical protein